VLAGLGVNGAGSQRGRIPLKPGVSRAECSSLVGPVSYGAGVTGPGVSGIECQAGRVPAELSFGKPEFEKD